MRRVARTLTRIWPSLRNATWCPGSKPTGAQELRKETTTGDQEDTHCLSLARRTAGCFGGWEYLVHENAHNRHGVWTHHVDMPTELWPSMKQAQKHMRQSHSLRDLLETQHGCVERRSVGRMEVAISGLKSDAQTEDKLADLVNAFITHAQEQMACEMGAEIWPNLVERPLKEGYRGSEWATAVEATISYYRGGKQALPDGGQRSCLSLAGRPDTVGGKATSTPTGDTTAG